MAGFGYHQMGQKKEAVYRIFFCLLFVCYIVRGGAMPVTNEGRTIGITWEVKCWECGWRYGAEGSRSGKRECVKAAADHVEKNYEHWTTGPYMKRHHHGFPGSLRAFLGL